MAERPSADSRARWHLVARILNIGGIALVVSGWIFNSFNAYWTNAAEQLASQRVKMFLFDWSMVVLWCGVALLMVGLPLSFHLWSSGSSKTRLN